MSKKCQFRVRFTRLTIRSLRTQNTNNNSIKYQTIVFNISGCWNVCIYIIYTYIIDIMYVWCVWVSTCRFPKSKINLMAGSVFFNNYFFLSFIIIYSPVKLTPRTRSRQVYRVECVYTPCTGIAGTTAW